jgi:hypothetical protein
MPFLNLKPLLKNLFLGLFLGFLLASLNSCVTSNQCIYASNNLLEKGKYKAFGSFSINSSYNPITEGIDSLTAKTELNKIFYPNTGMMGYYFRYGINKRWEIGGGGDVIIPAFNIDLKLNSTFLLLDKDKYKLGLFTQASGSAGFSIRTLGRYDGGYYSGPLAALYFESGLNYSINTKKLEICMVPRVRYNMLQGKKMHSFALVRDSLTGETFETSQDAGEGFHGFGYDVSNYTVNVLNRRRQFFSFGGSLIFNFKKDDQIRTLELSVMYDNLLPFISLGYKWPI